MTNKDELGKRGVVERAFQLQWLLVLVLEHSAGNSHRVCFLAPILQ